MLIGIWIELYDDISVMGVEKFCVIIIKSYQFYDRELPPHCNRVTILLGLFIFNYQLMSFNLLVIKNSYYKFTENQIIRLFYLIDIQLKII